MQFSGATETVRIACRRHDWTQALFDGKIAEPPIPFEIARKQNAGPASLVGAGADADYAECGLTSLLRARAAGASVKALPVFIRSAFRHSYIFINEGSGIKTPKDLEGKRVGTSYGMTASVWAKGLLKHEYGVELERIHWINGETFADERYFPPPGLVLESAGKNADLESWLVEHRIDALVHPSIIATKLLARGGVKRLFDDAGREERRSYRDTGIVPIMNVIACRDSSAEERPDERRKVFELFCKAKEIGLEALQNNRHSGLFWYWEALEEQWALMGKDPVPYSFRKNRHNLERFMTYAVEQGLVREPPALEELFFTGLEHVE